jgi:hypothetical protein
MRFAILFLLVACARPPEIPTTGKAVCAIATDTQAAEICDVAIEHCVVTFPMPPRTQPSRGECRHMGRDGRERLLQDRSCFVDKESGLITCAMNQ